uniref:Acidic phospholipase A2 homolog taipoxin gamma chain n=1 Tax=Oxyuranus scutellatus scutellatus TaxID=8667 RepID=PA2HG_OXYSC|nr:RecName: Full=Acidic phospholipase A2 homolog taipoxin gamma chain; Short=svPLA2 homolog; Flags: Precursor [Oxyuranus scutellatus scutellatus]AAY47068.1 gamma taipoxin-2 precursor [Oxyuranus scutellatus scutellatus]
MHPAHLLVLLAVCVSLLGSSEIPQPSLDFEQFSNMIQCTIPCGESCLAYMDYGCYCGPGGSGTPIDDLDRCCKTHDECYAEAGKLSACKSVLSEPNNDTYSYECNEGQLTCNDDNDECKAFICNCDRTAVTCFAGAPYNDLNYNIGMIEHCK